MKKVRYYFLIPYLRFIDYTGAAIFKRNMLPLHDKLHNILRDQQASWSSHIYAGGYFYQGWADIGIRGLRETNQRFEDYNISHYMSADKTCLDIGSNCGFFALKLGQVSKSVDAIEFNPFLTEIGKETAAYLDVNNVNFVQGDFQEYNFSKKYDYVFSLANHKTGDKNLTLEVRDYMNKIYGLLNNDGCLMFESHVTEANNPDKFRSFIQSFSDLFSIEQEVSVEQYKINHIGNRLFYVLRKVESKSKF